MQTKMTDDMWDIQKVKAVAVVSAGGSFTQSAAIYKPRSGPVMILLEYDDRNRLSRDLDMYKGGDTRYQGKYDGSLPYAWMVRGGRFNVHSQGWDNAERQWYDAKKLSQWLTHKLANHDLKKTMCLHSTLVIAMIDQAAGEDPRVFSDD